MSQEKTVPISVTAVRAEGYSSDCKEIVISLTTKYSNAERKYSVPVECLYDLIVDLQRLNAAEDGVPEDTSIQPADALHSSE
jgi:hypothetical protein